jgi:hypothetical protein
LLPDFLQDVASLPGGAPFLFAPPHLVDHAKMHRRPRCLSADRSRWASAPMTAIARAVDLLVGRLAFERDAALHPAEFLQTV